MIIWGINANNHDASIAVVGTGGRQILFAGHAERYSRIKNDPDLNQGLIRDALKSGLGDPNHIVWFENPWGRKLRCLRSGQWDQLNEISPRKYLERYGLYAPISYADHHGSHAAGGYYTSGFTDAAILVIDAIGEMTTASIWEGRGFRIKRKWQLKYPNSVGLFYSAITQLCGLKPNEEEYILMGMAAYGDSDAASDIASYIISTYYRGTNEIQQSFNFHRGVQHDETLNALASTESGKFALALAAQRIVTTHIQRLVAQAYRTVDSENLVYSGGVALNCVANSEALNAFKNVWIMPNPGDGGNSLGAAAYYLKKPLSWKGPFLGHNINDVLRDDLIVEELLTTGICGVANGRAEFGPRALGNRSLLADPRRADMKDRVNEVKHREKFRPFAPAVLFEKANECFEFPSGIDSSPYMQYVARVRNPELWPAIAHIDNTARVQTVDSEASNLRKILELWYKETGCPMLLNTSLNIKGEPLVNTKDDAIRWQTKYGIKVF